ncbi:hypothetical protein OVA14_00315 [Agrococcus sp. SL85]|uniref:hypothetical protein n=1 Tax=Agrococcus sp. SL85 TaxID=2995141 RepID=UPI00226D0815|nr:hypothetical protein [Agrococcus sp. SL85]WAC66287.1 hypothetical protein OVA14_00315 [Agrococcus sp. SL85]
METTDAAATRIPNPVTGSVDDGRPLHTIPTTPMLVGRYALVSWLPLSVLAALPFDLAPPLWLVLVALTLLVLCSWRAAGSLWRSVPPGRWLRTHLGVGAVVLTGWIAGAATGEHLIALVPALLALGGVLGAALLHWRLAAATPTGHLWSRSGPPDDHA